MIKDPHFNECRAKEMANVSDNVNTYTCRATIRFKIDWKCFAFNYTFMINSL